MSTTHIVAQPATQLQITSPISGHAFQWNDELAVTLAEELTPLLTEMPARERIAAMAYQIAFAASESDGLPCDDAATAELLGRLVERVCLAGLRAQRKADDAALTVDVLPD